MSETNLAPIILFCYNRPGHISRVIESLKKNQLAKFSDLYVFCDGPRSVKELQKIKGVHQIVDEISGFKSIKITKSDLNQGLASSVIKGVNEILQKHKKAIVLEDDIIVAKNFLNFMNDALNFYENDEEIFSITGFNYNHEIFKMPKSYQEDIFFVGRRGCSWGWATWLDKWNKVDFDVKDYGKIAENKKMQKDFKKSGENLFEMLRFQMSKKIDSWAIRVAFHQFKNNLYTVFPVNSLVKNIGFDGSGSHLDDSEKISDFEFADQEKTQFNFKKLLQIDCSQLANYYIKCANNATEPSRLSKKSKVKIKYFLLGLVIGIFAGYFLKF